MGHLIRNLLLLAIVLLVGAYFLGYLPRTESVFGSAPTAPPAKALPSNNELKERTARAVERVDETLADTALTTKIKGKIALDDTLKSANVHVHTKDGVVTISGTLGSAAMQERLMQLVRETAGVKSVVNDTKIASNRS